MLVQAFDGFTPAVKNTALGVLLSRRIGPGRCWMASNTAPCRCPTSASINKQTLAAHPDRVDRPRVQQLLDRGGGLPSPDRQQVMEQLLPLTQRTGDVAAVSWSTKSSAASATSSAAKASTSART
jgi:uncharacterized protein